jgi:hypothetical protein
VGVKCEKGVHGICLVQHEQSNGRSLKENGEKMTVGRVRLNLCNSLNFPYLFMIFSIELPSELIYIIIVVFWYILHITYNYFVTKTIMYFVAKYYSNFLCCNNYIYPSCDM